MPLNCENTSGLMGERPIAFRGGVAVVENTSGDRRVYLSHLQNLIAFVTQKAGGFNGWWVIGGVARAAILEKKDFVVTDPRGNWRDVDFLLSEPLAGLARKIQTENPTPLPAGTTFHNFLRVKPGESARLCFGTTSVDLPLQLFETQRIRLGEVEFPSLPPATLFHLFGGARKLREKDLLNALDLARWLRHHPDDYDESLYQGFHDFAKMARKPQIDSGRLLFLLAGLYRYSHLNRFLSITDPRILPFLEKIWWRLYGSSGRTESKKPGVIRPELQILPQK